MVLAVMLAVVLPVVLPVLLPVVLAVLLLVVLSCGSGSGAAAGLAFWQPRPIPDRARAGPAGARRPVRGAARGPDRRAEM